MRNAMFNAFPYVDAKQQHFTDTRKTKARSTAPQPPAAAAPFSGQAPIACVPAFHQLTGANTNVSKEWPTPWVVSKRTAQQHKHGPRHQGGGGRDLLERGGGRGGGGPWGGGEGVQRATMGQVCFTAISSNRACPTVFIALSSVFQIIVLCAHCPSVQWLGFRAKVASSLRLCTRVQRGGVPSPLPE